MIKKKGQHALKAGVLVLFLIFNCLFFLNKKEHGTDSINFALLKAYASSGGEYEENGGKSKEVFTGQKLFVTEVQQPAFDAGIRVGSLVDPSISSQIRVYFTATLKDCYETVCYKGGNCNCSASAWTMCASGGCPQTGIVTCGG